LKAHVHKLKVLEPDQLQFEQFFQLWNDDKVNRLDYYTSGLRRLEHFPSVLNRRDSQPLSPGRIWGN
jgi:hypothetical protein